MSVDYQVMARKSVKAMGGFAAATGVVALSAVVASGAAVGAIVEGFKAAGDAMKKVMAENENVAEKATVTEEAETVKEATVEEVTVVEAEE